LSQVTLVGVWQKEIEVQSETSIIKAVLRILKGL
jgi:hypothetical protein